MKAKVKIFEQAFTLIELMVVIAIMALLAGLLIPVVQKAMLSAKMTETTNNGKTVYQSILAAEIDDNYLMPSSSDPTVFTTSTEYWKSLLKTGSVDFTFDVFGAEGLTSIGGLDETKFTEKNNAWCIVRDVNSSTRSMTPVMFTRNLEVANIDEKALSLTETAPFGKNGLIVIRRDGSAHKLKEKDLADTFNPAEESKVVLRP